jgi:hypothetical protein
LASIGVKLSDGGKRIFFRNIFIANPNERNMAWQTASIELLRMLGLVNITDSEWIADTTEYDAFKNLYEYRSMELRTRKHLPDSDEIEVVFKKGIVSITSFGSRFLRVCT